MSDDPNAEQAGPARVLRVTVEVLEDIQFYVPRQVAVATDEIALEPGATIGDARLQQIAKDALGAAVNSAPKSVIAQPTAAAGEGKSNGA